jgi:hypothetical protein
MGNLETQSSAGLARYFRRCELDSVNDGHDRYVKVGGLRSTSRCCDVWSDGDADLLSPQSSDTVRT